MRRTAMLISMLALGAITSCSNADSASRSQCGTGNVGPSGGTVTSPSGASVQFPPGALVTSVSVSVCVVELGRVPHQRSPMIEFAPTALPLGLAVTITMPADTVTGVIAELRASPSDASFSQFDVAMRSPDSVSFQTARLGAVRLMDILADVDTGTLDLDAQVPDVNRPDAPRPIGPVVVGPDLTPADYACLAMVPTPTTGAPTPRTLHVIDWADESARAGYLARTFPMPTWDTSGSCVGYTDCSEGTSNASGDAAMMIDSGRAWVNVFTPTSTDPAHTASLQWVAGVVVPESATTIRLPVLSQHTQNAINMAMGFGGTMILGHVRDCSDGLVQRARVRIFGASSNTEIMFSPLGTRAITYGNGMGFPSGAGDRSSIDGVYLTTANGSEPEMRIEAWGHLALGGDDVLLSCETVSVATGQPVLLELRPLPSDIPSACGSVP